MSRVYTSITPELADYIRDVTLREPEALKRLREETENHPQASCQISAEQGQFLHVLLRAANVRQAIEVGVFMGYSSAWMALALPPGGKIIACDLNEEYAARARRTWQETGVQEKVELRLGPALRTLDNLLAEGKAGTFDFVFIDADKGNYANYFDRAYELLRPGGLIAVDNVLWRGDVVKAEVRDADTEAIRAFNRKVKDDPRVAITMATMGDGLTLAVKL